MSKKKCNFAARIIPCTNTSTNNSTTMNWLATLRLNFRLLPWRQALRLPIVVQGALRLDIGPEARIVLPSDAPHGTVVLGSRHETYKASAGRAQCSIYGTWQIVGRVRIGVDSCLYIHRGATLTTGADVYIARDSQVECAEAITLGNHVLAGEIYLCDTAAHKVSHAGVEQPMTRPIMIGDGCYFGFRTQVLRGAVIPPQCVIGSGAVCTRDYAAQHKEGHLLLAGVPAQIRATDVTPDCHV